MSSLLRRARPLSWARTAERRTAFFPTSAEARRPLGTSVKVILTQDITGTGYKGEHVDVSGGFMRNFLFPRKRAIYATEENKMLYAAEDRTAEKERAAALKALKRGRQELSAVSIMLKRHVPKDGTQPEKSVTAKDVGGYLRKSWQLDATEEDVRMPNDEPITSLGEHSIFVRAKLSETAVEILEEELGAEEFEEQAWVGITVLVEKMAAKRNHESEGEEEEGGGGGGAGDEGEGGRGDMSVKQ